MSIKITLEEMLKKRGLTSKELCELVDITEANMSILRSGRARAIRFDTLNKLCFYLQCSPGDLLQFINDGKEN